MFDINTKASGHFKVYSSEHELIGETDNLITDIGLDMVATRTWADSFKHLVAGYGSPDPQPSDDWSTLLGPVIGSSQVLLSSATYALNPACYTLGSWDSTNGMTYTLGRVFKLTNDSGSVLPIQDLGTSPSLSSSSYLLFSKAKLPSYFTMGINSFVYVVYELRLTTQLSTKVSQFQVDYNGSFPSHAFPVPNKAGVISLPFATVNSDGSVINNTFSSGHGFFEPSNTTNYLYKFGAGTPSLISYFDQKRTAFESNPALAINSTGTTHPNVSAFGISTSNALTAEGPYQSGTFQRTRHIIISPPSTPTVEKLWGVGISSATTTIGARDTGWQVVFSTEFTRPSATFLKMFVRQSWGRA